MKHSDKKPTKQSDEFDPDFISKTQLKKDALALKKFGLELAQLSVDKLKVMPISETTLLSILDYQKITTNLARKRQLMFVGKCLRNEDEMQIRTFLDEQNNSHLKVKVKAADPISELLEVLLSQGSEKIESLIEQYPNLDRQTLRQLIRNATNAKNPNKQPQAHAKLKSYLVTIVGSENS